jgi:hypothetical protein
MARIYHVKKAQQRYTTVPVLDENGQPKKVPMISSRTGEQKVTKTGRPVVMAVTVSDKTKPLPPYTCDSCQKPIEIGTPYKNVTPKSGPYGGRQRNRHESCPTWEVWELSNSWSARIAQATELPVRGFDASSAENVGDFEGLASELAEAIRELAQESEEAADNIESGFGHETFVSEEARERAQILESWADEFEGISFPDYPEAEEETCDECEGTGVLEDDADPKAEDVEDGQPATRTCDSCEGTGTVTAEEPSEEQIEAWQSECMDEIESVVGNCPV